MPKSLYLINPKPANPSYFGAEAFEQWGFPSAQAIADLATATVAALAPSDWKVLAPLNSTSPLLPSSP